MQLRAGIAAAPSASGPLARHPFNIATGADCRDRVGITPLAHAEFREERAHVRLKRRLELAMCWERIASLRGCSERDTARPAVISASPRHVEHALAHRI